MHYWRWCSIAHFNLLSKTPNSSWLNRHVIFILYNIHLVAKFVNNWRTFYNIRKYYHRLKHFDLQWMERYLHQGHIWPVYFMVRRNRNILVPVWNIELQCFKQMCFSSTHTRTHAHTHTGKQLNCSFPIGLKKNVLYMYTFNTFKVHCTLDEASHVSTSKLRTFPLDEYS
jgi:hypothetical protein